MRAVEAGKCECESNYVIRTFYLACVQRDRKTPSVQRASDAPPALAVVHG